MHEQTAPDLLTLNDLRRFVHRTLCERENLLAEQFQMRESQLLIRGQVCGIQFSLKGPRSIRLNAIWTIDQNQILFYGTQGVRFLRVQLPNPIPLEAAAA